MRFTLATMFVLSILSSTAQGVESLNKPNFLARVLGYIGQSTPVYLYGKYINSKFISASSFYYTNEPASKMYQDLGIEGQQALGIPQNRWLPIKKMSSQPFIGAEAASDALYINEEKLDSQSIGFIRSVLTHEATHAKYNDAATRELIGGAINVGSLLGAYKAIKAARPQIGFKPRCLAAVMISVIGDYFLVDKCVNPKFTHFIERRADIEGCYATGCSTCVQEKANLRRKMFFEQENHPLKYAGHLWPQELEQIVQDLKQENKVCEHHHVINEQS